ncbi:MAG: tail fiber domain-containing protein [Gammaproteobacteria bacterium]|nr:tail fiber domain-containing protein [Gammaproteobacteria bacterium]
MAFSRPSVVPLIDSNSTNRVAPPAGKQTDGYVLNDILPSSEFDWAQGFNSDWLSWLDERSADGTNPTRDFFLKGVDALPASAVVGGDFHLDGGSGDGANNGGEIIVRGGAGGATGSGGAVELLGGDGGGTSGDGGNIQLTGGGPSTLGNGGSVLVDGGAGVGASGVGGSLLMTAGDAGSPGGTGGNVSISAGNLSGGGTPGNVTIQSGDTGGTGSSDGGTITMTTGDGGPDGAGGAGGSMTITLGDGNQAQAGGGVTVNTGAGGATGAGGDMTVTLGAGGGPAAGGGLTMTAGVGGATGAGGMVTISAGAGGATLGDGGALTLEAGDGAGSASGNGGVATIRAGDGSEFGDGGALTLRAGDATGSSGNGGALTVRAGNAEGFGDNGGTLSLLGGLAPSGPSGEGNGGSVIIAGQNSAMAAGVPGDVTIMAGDDPHGTQAGGVFIRAGTSTNQTSEGVIELRVDAVDALRVNPSATDAQPTVTITNSSSVPSGGLGSALRVRGVASSSTAVYFYKADNGATTRPLIEAYSDITATETLHMVVRIDGDLENTNNSYAGISDVREKSNVKPLSELGCGTISDDIFSVLRAVCPIEYSLTDKGLREPDAIGFDAEEVQKVLPHLVRPSALKTNRLALNQMGMVPVLWEALCRLIDRVEALEASVTA